MSIERFPLAWPVGRPRKRPAQRRDAQFSKVRQTYNSDGSRGDIARERLTIADALKRLQNELDRLGARLPVISSNLELRLDGLPRSGQPQPDDPGVAVYFRLPDSGKPLCLPCDTYTKVQDNIAAIAKHIEATRAIERYGVATIAEQFAGFQALPAPGSSPPWWIVLQVKQTATRDEIEAAYRKLAVLRHPDRGGSGHQMAELNGARAAAIKERCS